MDQPENIEYVNDSKKNTIRYKNIALFLFLSSLVIDAIHITDYNDIFYTLWNDTVYVNIS